jgi:hypothetical protein
MNAYDYGRTTMHALRPHGRIRSEWLWLLLILIALLLYSTGAFAAAKNFASAEDAVNALVAAVKAHDRKAIHAVLGTSDATIESGDAVADRTAGENFVKSYDTKHSLVADGDVTKLTIGENDFPFAFPLVKTGDRWHFDTEAGLTELSARRIGRNEIYAMKVLQAIVDAQHDYASEDRNGNGVFDYATKFLSSPGKRDGLYWPTKAGEQPSPLGELVADASAEGYKGKKGEPAPYHGYYYRMLKGQSASANGGALDYVVHGRAIGGYAVVAYPAKYGNSGIMTFIVNQDGKIFESDLGPNTPARATAMQRFDPGKGWAPASPQ